MINAYWPSKEGIEACIRTEAEELAEHVLLAVHEPMTINRRLPDSSVNVKLNEEALLEHLLNTDRPIPIIGESGIGKSHLIRWIDAKLKTHPSVSEWHIKRIPKNASLRGVLEILLDGLSGDDFEKIRKEISSVGDQITVRDVADHLVVSIGQQLEKLAEEAQSQLNTHKKQGTKPSQELEARCKFLLRHAISERLPALINDPYFNYSLKNDDSGCIYQIAKRLTGHSDGEEIFRNNFEFTEKDINFDFDISNLNVNAKNYIIQASLNSNKDKRNEVKDLLNEVINDASKETFYRLFQFNSGSFQELFTNIRRQLLEDGKTLVILVEDMAAISAIEDVLIDSLMEEGVRDGKRVLCPLKSAFAVTQGYTGYRKRRNTLATRARFEWYLPNNSEDDDETLERIYNFCGRYINAARIGEKKLRQTYPDRDTVSRWPEVWNSGELDDQEEVNQFNCTRDGVPLFPLNKRAIKALVENLSSERDSLLFNPRIILQNVLRQILFHERIKFEQSSFPPANLCNIPCPGQLAIQLTRESFDEPGRIQSLAAIWGYGAKSLNELVNVLPAAVPRAFKLDDFSRFIEASSNGPLPDNPIAPKPAPQPDRDKPLNGKPNLDDSIKISEDVDEWFKYEDIPQKEAQILRQCLLTELNKVNVYWWGIKKLPPMQRGTKIRIYIPFNKNNLNDTLISLGSIEEFKKNEVLYKGFISAVLRNNHFGSWNYEDGYEDYCLYRDFLANWLKTNVEELVDKHRMWGLEAFSEHAKLACALIPRFAKMNNSEKIAHLSKPQQSLKQEYPITGIGEWDEFVKESLERWETLQSDWLTCFSTKERRALEGDLIKLKQSVLDDPIPASTSRLVNKICNELSAECKNIKHLLLGCETKEEYLSNMADLKTAVELMVSEGQYSGMEDYWGSKKFLNKLKKIEEANSWNSIKTFLRLEDVKNEPALLSNIKKDQLLEVEEVLENWTILFTKNNERIKEQNYIAGADSRVKKKERLDKMWAEYSKLFIEEVSVK